METQSLQGLIKKMVKPKQTIHIAEVSELISESKDEYHNKLAIKLNNSKTRSKTIYSQNIL